MIMIKNDTLDVLLTSLGIFLGLLGVVGLFLVLNNTSRILDNLGWLILSALSVSLSLGILKKVI
ncbi:hypothetical protein J4476_00500 [Candidatus Woesearchaeota archaeon]|nr:MAG: hypothetical protein QT09_C0005G0009 [archaeon GW2011_AR18]MBS3161163.1 hypothetical protein [Candidatus Woesearchaeota archaeon]HIH25963.1 hypothetical protein [Nanoarchaeota archaeon]